MNIEVCFYVPSNKSLRDFLFKGIRLKHDESRSISENSTWGIRRRFEQGKVIVNHKKFLGYDKDEEGNLIINEKQAKIVRRIYNEFLEGKGASRIAKDLENEKIKNWNGEVK